jgi:hypothetical protein
MVNVAPTAIDHLAESVSQITNSVKDGVPIIGNAAICADSLCITDRAGINFYCSSNPVSKAFFGANFLCGLMGAGASGTALVTSFAGIPMAG